MNKIVSKFFKLFSRRQRAKKWGVKFSRVKNFQLPKFVILEGKEIELNLPTSDTGMLGEFVEIILDDCYKLKSWQKQLKPDAKILDIGGNVGLFSLAARHAFPKAKIHSYEPNPALEKYLKHQAGVAGFDYYMKALGAEDGKVRLKFSEKGASGNTVSIVDEEGDISTIALSKAIENLGNFVDLMKIDCEGAEWNLFETANVWDKIQNITMEYHLYKKGQTLEKIKTIIRHLQKEN